MTWQTGRDEIEGMISQRELEQVVPSEELAERFFEESAVFENDERGFAVDVLAAHVRMVQGRFRVGHGDPCAVDGVRLVHRQQEPRGE